MNVGSYFIQAVLEVQSAVGKLVRCQIVQTVDTADEEISLLSLVDAFLPAILLRKVANLVPPPGAWVNGVSGIVLLVDCHAFSRPSGQKWIIQ